VPTVPDVHFVVGGGGELEAAVLAAKGLLLTVVHATVGYQLTLLGKTLVTLAAGEWLLSCHRKEQEGERVCVRERKSVSYGV